MKTTPSAPPNTPSKRETRPATILIVEDEYIIAHSLKRLLRTLGYNIVGVATTGSQAIQMAWNSHPDLILMDIHLADKIDGITAATHIQAQQNVLIIYLTGYGDQSTLARIKITGPAGYLLKPVAVAELQRTIEIALYRHRMEQQLRESEARYRTLVERVPIGLFRTTPNGQILDINPAGVKMLGYPDRESLLAKNARDVYVEPQERQKMIAHLEENDQLDSFETQFRRYDSEIIWIREHVQRTWNEKGQSYFEGSLEDITARKKAEHILQQSHDELEQRVTERTAELRRYADEQAALYAVTSAAASFLEPVALLNAVLDAILPILKADASWVVLPAKSLDRAPQILTWRGVPASFLTEISAHLHACPAYLNWLSGKLSSTETHPLIRHCPRLTDELRAQANLKTCIGVPLRVGHKVLGIIGIGWADAQTHIDELQPLLVAIGQQVGMALHNAQLYQVAQAANRLETINAIGMTAISSLNPDDVLPQVLEFTCFALDAAAGSILLRDPQTDELIFAQTLAATRSNLKGQRLPPGRSIAGWVVANRRTARVPDVHADARWYAELDARTGFDTHSLLCTPLFYHDNVTGVIEIVNKHNDVFSGEDANLLEAIAAIAAVAIENAHLYANLHQALTEQERTQAQLIQAEKLSALGRLAASVAHEINNPLQAVLGCMRLSQEELSGRFRKEKLDQHLAIAVTEVKRVSEIVQRMQDFYRQTRTEISPINVTDSIDSVLALSNKQLQHSAINVQCDYATDLPAIEANPDHLKQVFLNLVINAIDAMPKGGRLHIRAYLLAETDSPQIEISVTDTGTGITPEMQNILFEPFFTTKEHGSGLGLSISYGIILAHHGQITVHSQVGEGTTFTITLPLSQPD